MLRKMRFGICCGIVAILLLSAVGWAEPIPAKIGNGQLGELRQRIEDTMSNREQVLMQKSKEIRDASLEDRVRLEAEYARLAEGYETEYLTLLVDYHRLTGNVSEQRKAEAMLAALTEGKAAPATQTDAKKGVNADEK